MELFRSEEVHLMQLMIPAEAAHNTITALGEVGMLQFKDLNADKSAFQRTYANQIKRCDEMARQVRFFQEELRKASVPAASLLPSDRAFDFDRMEGELLQLESELSQLTSNSERLRRSHNELLELQLVLERAGVFFSDARSDALATREEDEGRRGLGEGPALSDIGAPLLESASAAPEASKGVQLGFVAGTVLTDRLAAFERLLFRATRGNVYLRSAGVGSVEDPSTGERHDKAVYVVFFSGERARLKISKAAEAFGAARYPFPEDRAAQRAMHADVSARLRELAAALEAGERARLGALQSAAGRAAAWGHAVRREKAVFHTLNKLSVDATRKVLVAEAWVPLRARGRVAEALRTAARQAGSTVGTVFQPIVTYEAPPTHFETGKVTAAFQEIVDAYGIARYREANPGVLTIVTFPFLFAVMFGDLGHGAMLLAVGAALVLAEKRLGRQALDEMTAMLFSGRYVVLLMGAFSIFTGLVYNEFFSMPTTIFGGTRWRCATDAGITDADFIKMHPGSCPSAFVQGLAMRAPHDAYPFGVDPAWHGTRTELPFLNSVKMKMSIVMGVVQMNAGIAMSYLNQRYFGDALSTACEFVPQVIFLNSLFGYLVVLIVAKWVSGSVVDLYHVLIYMFLSPGNVDCNGTCPENKLFRGQGVLQVLLLLAAFVCVPWMLLPKPLVLKKRAQRRAGGRDLSYGLLGAAARNGHASDGDDAEMGGEGAPLVGAGGASSHLEIQGGGGGHSAPPGHHEEFDFGEIMVHQMIHTIEFVLGAVSNTASYLRLWALSLAHSQLSAVFYDRVLMRSLQSQSPVAICVGFYIWFCATLGVLMGMESLSAFLHALRLHWVEFNNKFFHGDGYKFMPFSFAEIDQEEL